MASTRDRRRDASRKAWAEAFARLCEAAGPDWPLGSDLSDRDLIAAEHAANAATTAYVERGVDGARAALKRWEDLMMVAIRKAKDLRGCGECGHEKVVEVVAKDGSRMCGRCMAGK